jgi:hypothetical protein
MDLLNNNLFLDDGMDSHKLQAWGVRRKTHIGCPSPLKNKFMHDKFLNWIGIIILVAMVVIIAFWGFFYGFLGYVIWHFISKLW